MLMGHAAIDHGGSRQQGSFHRDQTMAERLFVAIRGVLSTHFGSDFRGISCVRVGESKMTFTYEKTLSSRSDTMFQIIAGAIRQTDFRLTHHWEQRRFEVTNRSEPASRFVGDDKQQG